MTLSIVKNKSGFLSGIEFNKKALKALPAYTQDQNDALIVYPHFMHVLKFHLSNFDFFECEFLPVNNDQEKSFLEEFKERKTTAKSAYNLEKESYKFKDECSYIKKLVYLNLLRSDVMKSQEIFINFFKGAKFLTCGDLCKKDNETFKTLCDKYKSNISKSWCGGNIWLTFRAGSFEEMIYIIMKEEEEQQLKDLKKITLVQYKKRLEKIEKNKKLISDLKSELSRLKTANYL